MKTKSNSNSFFAAIRLPEIISWIIGLMVFTSLLLSLNLIGQEQEKYTKDTLWLKTGEVVPCLITGSNSFTNEVTKSPKIFIGFGGGWPGTAGVSLNFLAKNDMGGSISYKFRSVRSNNEPSDYDGWWGTPGDEVSVFSACFVKAFPSKTTRLVRFAVEGGPSWINYSEAHFSKSSSWFSNYSVSYTTKNTVGLTLRAKLELPLSQAVGFELALTGNINPIRSFAGLEIYLTLGRVRDRKEPKQ